MSFIINPVITRLGYSKYWNTVWCLSKNINYSFLIFCDELIISYISFIVNKYWLKLLSYFLSHIKLFRNNSKINIVLFIRIQLLSLKYYFFSLLYNVKKQQILKSDLLQKKQQILKFNILHKKKKNSRWIKQSNLIIPFLQQYSIFRASKLRFKIIKKQYFKFIKILLLYCLYSNNFFSFFLNKYLFKNIWKFNLLWFIFHFMILRQYFLFLDIYIHYKLNLLIKFNFIYKINLIFLSSTMVTSEFLTKYIKHKLIQGHPIRNIIKMLLFKFKVGIHLKDFKGVKICINGRFTRSDRKLFYWKSLSKIGYTNVMENLDYFSNTIILKNSICGIKVWINQAKKLKYFLMF